MNNNFLQNNYNKNKQQEINKQYQNIYNNNNNCNLITSPIHKDTFIHCWPGMMCIIISLICFITIIYNNGFTYLQLITLLINLLCAYFVIFKLWNKRYGGVAWFVFFLPCLIPLFLILCFGYSKELEFLFNSKAKDNTEKITKKISQKYIDSNNIDNSKDNPADNSKDNIVENSKDNPADNSKDNIADNSKDNSADNSKDNPADNSKNILVDYSKYNSKNNTLDIEFNNKYNVRPFDNNENVNLEF